MTWSRARSRCGSCARAAATHAQGDRNRLFCIARLGTAHALGQGDATEDNGMIRFGRCMFRCMLALAALLPIQTAFVFAAEQVDLLLVLPSAVPPTLHHPPFLLPPQAH